MISNTDALFLIAITGVIGVGVGHSNPSIRYLEHGADVDVQPNVADFDSFNGCYESYSKDFKSILGAEYFDLKHTTKHLVSRFNSIRCDG
ncbi:MAG: hypothetical protein WAM42_23605 [Candidatus Nitrosopolaris sp.]